MGWRISHLCWTVGVRLLNLTLPQSCLLAGLESGVTSCLNDDISPILQKIFKSAGWTLISNWFFNYIESWFDNWKFQPIYQPTISPQASPCSWGISLSNMQKKHRNHMKSYEILWNHIFSISSHPIPSCHLTIPSTPPRLAKDVVHVALSWPRSHPPGGKGTAELGTWPTQQNQKYMVTRTPPPKKKANDFFHVFVFCNGTCLRCAYSIFTRG